MGGNRYAVLIGINHYADSRHLPTLKYAEKDCQDLCRALTMPDVGTFSRSHVRVLYTPEETTTDYIREVLYQEVVQKPGADDMVIVYFSGHGFIIGDHSQRAYLGTSDVDIMTLMTRNMRAGLPMDELHQDFFMRSNAQNVLFILDSCHSGAFVPSLSKGSQGDATAKRETDRPLIEKGFFSSGMGRFAIVSSPAHLPSYESQEFENSIFTHYLVKGLEGEAIEAGSRDITIDSLLAYVCNHAPSDQLPGRYGQYYGRIVLAQAPHNRLHSSGVQPIVLSKGGKPSTFKLGHELNSLTNPIAPYQGVLEQLIERLGDRPHVPSTEVERRILEAICRATGASFAAVLRQDGDRWVCKAQVSLSDSDSNGDSYGTLVFSELLPHIDHAVIFATSYHGLCHPFDVDNTSQMLMLVPLHPQQGHDLMVLAGAADDSLLGSEVVGRMVTAIYQATHELTTLQSTVVESAVLDNLKTFYGFLPPVMYDRRLALFHDRLHQMEVQFQPVLYLDLQRPYIDSWEALARQPDQQTAPTDLFETVELWGDRFMIDLDIYFLKQAIASYCESSSYRRAEDEKELSVNVYPQSLVRRAYFEAVREVINTFPIQPHKLILEISEKLPLPPSEDSRYPSSMAFFKNKLEQFIQMFNIEFAIDDFGVGHASVSRLAGLNPVHVKIDRDILTQGAVDLTLKFVREMLIRRYLRAPKIVIEGVDQDSPLGLNQLYQMGATYVQGYQVGSARPDLRRLEKDEYDTLRWLIANDSR